MLRLAIVVIGTALSSGCAHYYFPVNRLDVPESRGLGQIGRLEVAGTQMGTYITAPSVYSLPDEGEEAEPQLQTSYLNYHAGFSVGVTEQLDLGARLQIGAPFLIRAKYQFYGDSETKSQKGNFSAAVAASGGALLGRGHLYYMGDAALLGGYRFAARHLVSAGTSFGLAGLSGVEDYEGSGNQLTLFLGYQYTIQSIFLRLEIAYVPTGTWKNQLESNITGGYGAAMLGLLL